MQVMGLNHVSILVNNADQSLAFYQSLLGLACLPRPDLGFAGYWLDLHNGQSLHLMELPATKSADNPPAHGGRDYHFALQVDNVAAFKTYLDANNIPYTSSRSGRKAVFIRDLDANALELFEA